MTVGLIYKIARAKSFADSLAFADQENPATGNDTPAPASAGPAADGPTVERVPS